MAFQEAAQSFVELLRKLCDSSLHISCVANTLYAHEEPRRPSLNDATKACEELKMDVLENHFRLMKVEYKERQSQLTAKMNKGLSLTADEEEWIDGKGNLIDGELLIGRLSALASASGNESIHLNSDNVKTFSEIHDFHPKKSTKLPDRKKIAAKKNDKPEKTNTEKQKVLTSGKDSSTKKSAIQSNKDSSVKESVIPPTNVIPKDSGEIQTVIAAKVNSSDKQSSVQKSKRKSADLAHSSSQISNASYAEKVQVLDWHHKNGKNQTKTSAHFQKIFPLLKIKQPLLSKWLKAEDTIRAKHQESSHDATKRIRTLTYPKVEAALSEWMTQAVHYSLPITGEIIKEKWRDFARLDGIPSEEWLKLSSGWLESFKTRHQLRTFRKHGEAASVDITVVESEVVRMQEITKDYNLKDIFNMDETGLFYSMPPDVGLAFKATHGVKSDKTRLTLALTCNADGSEKKPLLFIGKSKKPRSFKGHMAEYYNYEYAHNSTAWMTAEIFQRWLKSWNSKLKEEDRNILLLLDNFRGHTLPDGGLSHIRVEFFSPNLTSHVQPLDAGIIKCFKSYYRKKAILRSINLFTEEMDKEEKTPMKNMFKVDQLLAMRMSQKAWDSVSALTIANCWGVTKIIKQSPNSCLEVINKSIENSTAALESQLNTLEFIGAVLPRNRMSISNLLDPEGENNHALQMRSDEEIFASVHNEDGEEDLVDCNPNSKEPEIPRPSKKDMCSIISRALRYLEDMDDSDSNKLTDLLETYQQKVLNDLHFKGQQAGIRDYFNPVTPQTTSTSRIEPSQKPPVASTSKVTLEMFV
ncbi:hypothetical protein MJO29_006499 [Puccinia striiformis f. sp. tritici]|nr:hypothetical protein MJO29_006499 [Puccinia striiformis f. sp. tritici]